MSRTPRPIKVVITLDTEADNVWQSTGPPTTENLHFIPRFQKLCDRYGLKPTYLCTYEIAESPAFDILAAYPRDGVAEIGAHLHPWTTPPLRDDPDQPPKKYYPSELPDDEFREKMQNLTRAIEARAGLRPTSYRAGRFGFRASHIPILLDLGYSVECSVTPLAGWHNQIGVDTYGPDFRSAPAAPYYLNANNVCRAGDTRLLEVPVTIVCDRELRLRALRKIIKSEDTRAFRAACRLLGITVEWFRPFPYMTAGRMKAVYRAVAERGLPVADLMFHSSELMPGGSPYNPTAESVEGLYARLEELFRFIAESGGEGTTLSELITRS